jgi:uncharacterized membrane protein YkoI
MVLSEAAGGESRVFEVRRCMMNRKHWKLVSMVVLIGAIVCVMSYAGKKEKKKNISLPEAVKQVITEKYPGAKIESVEREDEGPVILEVKLALADGVALEVMFATDGTLMEVENEIAPVALPDAVLAALPQNAKIKEAEQKIIHAVLKPVKLDDPQTVYEVEVEINGKEVEIEVAADGTIISRKVEDDDEGDDDDDGDDEDDEDEEEVTLDEVPAAVKATILANAQGGTIEEIERETEDGQVVYEAEVVINGKEYDIEVAADGKLLEIEEEDEEDDDDDDDDDDAEEEDDN